MTSINLVMELRQGFQERSTVLVRQLLRSVDAEVA